MHSLNNQIEEEINFHFEGISSFSFSEYLPEWIKSTILSENNQVGTLNYIFCSDDYLLNLNQDYLQHDTYTDIITFDYTENKIISSDIFISIDRIQENSQTLNTPFIDELERVCIHGILHLCGYKDKSKQESELMREKEDFYLNLRPF